MLELQVIRRTALAAVVAAGASLLPMARAVAQAVPSAQDVIAKHIAAVGGMDKLKTITSVRQVGQMSMPAMGLNADAEMIMAAPNKANTKMTIPGIGEIVQGTDGEVGWSVNPMQGPRLLTDKELEQAKEQADFGATMLFAADRFSAMENLGIVDFAGEKAYKIKLVAKGSGNITHRLFSVASGLMIGYESTSVTEMGNVEQSTVVGDYKEFGGLKFATKNETTMGPQKLMVTITEVQVNAVPADAVSPPEAVKPLIKK